MKIAEVATRVFVPGATTKTKDEPRVHLFFHSRSFIFIIAREKTADAYLFAQRRRAGTAEVANYRLFANRRKGTVFTFEVCTRAITEDEETDLWIISTTCILQEIESAYFGILSDWFDLGEFGAMEI